MKVNYKIKYQNNIFHVVFKDQYDMCMTMLRAQETYESPNSKFRNKIWNKEDFMRWYAKTYGNGVFTYTKDWSGFNHPKYIGEFIFDNHVDTYQDEYDMIYYRIYSKCLEKATTGKFYIIATLENAQDTIEHEVAHGLFYLNDQYKKEMITLVKQLKPKLRNACFKNLKDMGYTSKVFVDECQAYFATGLAERFTFKVSDKTLQQFQEVFKKYYGN